MIEVRNVDWGGYYHGGRRSILARLERVQSKVNKIYSADDVADSNASINGNDSDGSNSDNEGNDSFYSDGGDLSKLYISNSDDSRDNDKGQHSNASDMAIHAEDGGMDDPSGPNSNTTDENSVDLLNSD